MKILIISNLYEPYQRGGAEVVVKRTALALLRAGHEVLLLTSRPYGGIASLQCEEEVIEGVRVLRYYPFNLFYYPRDVQHSLPVRCLWHLFDLFNHHSAVITRRVLRREAPDLVITHNLMGLGFRIPREIRRARLSHIHVLHDIQLAVRSGLMRLGEEHRFYTAGWLAKIYQFITKIQFGSPRQVISPSQYLLDFYSQRGFFAASRKTVLRNPVDRSFYEQSLVPTADGCLHLAFVGQLAAHKGLLTLREAMGLVSDPNVRLHVIGAGPMAREVSSWEKEDKRIRYEGKIANEVLPSFLARMQGLVLPTLTYENSPSVIFEALAEGLPVIVSDIGGAAEVIKEGRNGFLVPPGNASQLAAAIGALSMFVTKKNPAIECKDSVSGLDADAYVRRLMALALQVQNDR